MAGGASPAGRRDRKVALVSAGAVLLVVCIWLVALSGWLTSESFALLRTNSVTATQTVAIAAPERRVCVRNELIPARTQIVELQVARAHRRTAAKRRALLAVSGKRGALAAKASISRKSELLRFRLARPVARTITGARLCIDSPDGPLRLRGSSSAPTGWIEVGGRSIEHAIPRITYLSAQKVSAASQVGTVLKRASMFRPGWVGPWTYWLLAALVLVAMAAALWALIMRGGGGWSDRRWLLLISLVVLVNGLTWSIVTPPLQAPDEGEHFSYVETLADRGLGDVRDHAKRADFGSLNERTVVGVALNPANKVPWYPLQEQTFQRSDRFLRESGSATGASSAQQYVPLYYAIAVIPYKLTPGGIIAKDWGLRLFSILLTIITAMLVFLAAREVAPKTEWIAPFAGLFAAFQPMLLHIGAAAHLDPFVTMLTALLVYLVARTFRSGVTTRRALGIGLTLALATVAKPISVTLAPAVLVAALFVLKRDRPERAELLRIVLAGALPFVLLVGMSYALFHATAGVVNQAATTGTPQIPMTPSSFLSYTWQWFLPKTWFMQPWFNGGTWAYPPPFFTIVVPGFFANFNYLDTAFPFALYRVIAGVGVLATLCALVGAVRYWRDRASWLPMTAFGVTAMLATWAFLLVYGFILAVRLNMALIQGRYFLPLITFVALLFAAAAFSVSRRWAPLLAALMIVSLALLNVSSYGLSLMRFYL